MRVLVTGASGFLGRHLCRALKERGIEVFPLNSKNCDLRHPKSLDMFNPLRFDRLYHLAAWTQAGDFCLKFPADQWIINQQINTHVLNWWRQRQPQATCIAIGTSCAYDPSLPLEESYYLKGEPIDSLFTYAMTKRMLLAGLQACHKQEGLSYLYVIPSTLYGPDYHLDGRQPHFIFDLIRKLLIGKETRAPVVLWGDGEQKRELVHVNDFVKTLLFLEDQVSNTHINIGAGKEFSIKEFAKILSEIIGFQEEKIVYDPSKYVGARSKCLSTLKLQQYFPQMHQISLMEGLQETVAWMRKAGLSL